MMHLAAYYQSADSAGAELNINAVSDQAIFTTGADVRVPTDLPNLLAETVMSAQTGLSYGVVSSPSLRAEVNQYVDPAIPAVVFGSNPAVQHHFENPRKLNPLESINVAVDATGGAAAVNYGLIWLGDGAPKTVNGDIFTVRATSAAALSAGAWVNAGLTFAETLPAGTYQIVGMRAQGTNLVAARLVFIGAAYRPGVPAVNSVGQREWKYGRNGALGVFGEFDSNQPPTVDCLGVTDTSQAFAFDMIKVK